MENTHIVSWNWASYGSRESRKYLTPFSVGKVSRNGPACLSLPPGVVDNHLGEVQVNPLDSVGIASFSDERVGSD
jgi:hypothetical protein